MKIRLCQPEEFGRLDEIELAAGTMFAQVGMASEVFAELNDPDELAAQLADGSLWVAVDERNVVMGYLALDVVDGNAHLEQVSVDPAFARRRIGVALVGHAIATARQRGFAAMTLTTYRDVPWNGPYYKRLGFRPLSEAKLTPGLVAIRILERAKGLDEWPRIAMTRPL